MNIKILTLFENYFDDPLSVGIIGNCVAHNHVNIDVIGIRQYGYGSYRKCDDYPYGGGAGLVMTADLFERYYVANAKKSGEYTVLLTPTGGVFNQAKAREFSEKDNLTFILGHYEGVDARVESAYVDESVSIGDYVLSGGEAAVLVIIDAICRYKGGLGNENSLVDDTFESGMDGLLEYEQYTRPDVDALGQSVPSILLSGDHKKIAEYRRLRSLIRTFNYRKDLFAKADITKKDIIAMYNYLAKK